MFTPKQKFLIKIEWLKFKKRWFGRCISRVRSIPAGESWWGIPLDQGILVYDTFTEYSIRNLPANIRFEFWRKFILPTKIGRTLENMRDALLEYRGKCPEDCEGMCCDPSYDEGGRAEDG